MTGCFYGLCIFGRWWRVEPVELPTLIPSFPKSVQDTINDPVKHVSLHGSLLVLFIVCLNLLTLDPTA